MVFMKTVSDPGRLPVLHFPVGVDSGAHGLALPGLAAPGSGAGPMRYPHLERELRE
jgi:hypothetical protein